MFEIRKTKRKNAKIKFQTWIYKEWLGIKTRCYNINHSSYLSYGGRGIKLCDEWLEYENFKEWSFNNNYSEELTIDRLNTNKNYCPENCRWATHEQQVESRHNNRRIIAFGENKTLMDWIEDPRCKVCLKSLKNRLKSGWSTEDAIAKNEDPA